MSAPSAQIDASLSPANGVYWVLELGSVWKTENLGGGNATWMEAYTAAIFEAANDCTDCIFIRVVAPSDDMVYVYTYAKKNGEAQGSAWMLVSNRRGETWNAYVVEDGITTSRDYKVTTRYGSVTQSGGKTFLEIPHPRIGDADNTYNPWALATRFTGTTGDVWSGLDENSNSIHAYGQTTLSGSNKLYGRANQLLGAGDEIVAEGWITEYCGSFTPYAGTGLDLPKEANRVNVRIYIDHANGEKAYWVTYVFWNVPSPIMPKALGVSPTNNNWLYVGLADKIKASETGGVSWFDFYTGHGANDICVDPQLAGAIYYWSTDGNLNLLVKQAVGGAAEGVLTSTGLMTETPLDRFGRVARDPSSGILLGLPNGTVLTRRMNGANANLKTGLSDACGMNFYPGQKLILVDDYEVWTSEDIQAGSPTITAKKGGWTTYANGVQGHRMV